MSNSKNSKGISEAALSVVNIIATNSSNSSGYRMRGNQEIVGSGIIISDDGYIITNLHIIDRKKEINVELEDGQIKIANVIGYDQRSDLAVIKISSEELLIPIKLANSKSIYVGDEVFAIGNAFGLGKTFTSGIVSATGRDYGNPYLELIQTDAAINPGNSGGALVNSSGELIGINTAIISISGGADGIGFAIPIDIAKYVLEEIIENGEVIRGYVGISAEINYRGIGVLVNGVISDSPADRAGVKPYDIIKKVNQNVVTEIKEVQKIIGLVRPGETLSMEILRDRKLMDVNILVSKMNYLSR